MANPSPYCRKTIADILGADYRPDTALEETDPVLGPLNALLVSRLQAAEEAEDLLIEYLGSMTRGIDYSITALARASAPDVASDAQQVREVQERLLAARRALYDTAVALYRVRDHYTRAQDRA